MDDREERNRQLEATAKEFLRSYRMHADLLNLYQYERKQRNADDGSGSCGTLGDEAFWRAEMARVESLIASMSNGKEKLMLYYRYIKGESIERIADLLDVSRRTGYRMHLRGLRAIGAKLERMQKSDQEIISKPA